MSAPTTSPQAPRSLFFLALLAAALAAILLRLVGITWGFPFTFNADEPHLVNLAVSFGGGSLNPYAFKYPTLWPYLLFFSYGLYFAVWSALGLRHCVADFIGLYVWRPAGFYLIGRLLSTLFSLLAVGVVWKTEKRLQSGPTPWAALLLAFSPVIVELAHTCKPDSMMFFFSCAAWYFALCVYQKGGRRDHWACGAAFGLALSSQYTALPLALVLPLAHFLGKTPSRPRWLLEGAALASAAFLIGSPFALIDFHKFWFWMSMRDSLELEVMGSWDRLAVLRAVLLNLWNFAGPWSLGGLAAAIGFLGLLKRERNLALVLMGPAVLYAAILSGNPDGGWQRYLLGSFPALALLAAQALFWADRPGRPLWTTALAALMLGPGIIQSARLDRAMTLLDTRHEAARWILSRVPQGATLLLDSPHASPRVPMTREQAEELWKKTKEAGSPRSRFYRAMADTHPGGGYRIFQIQRSAKDLATFHPKQVKLSQADAAMLDVASGLRAVRAAGVDYAVLSSFGFNVERAPELTKFVDELARDGRLVKVFEPVEGEISGPQLKVYRITPNQRRGISAGTKGRSSRPSK